MNEDRATRYHRLKRQTSLVSLAWAVILLAGLVWTGASIRLRDAAEAAGSVVGHGWPGALAAIAVYVFLLSLAHEIVGLPLGYYAGFVLERRYGLSNQGVGSWLRDEAKAFALGLVLGSAAVALIYGLMAVAPVWWWLAAAVAFAGLIVVLANLAPVLLLPLFYPVKPLERDALRARLIALAERAGARVLGVYEWGLGSKTKKANAALAGIGGTRRILVSDTLLAEYSDDEIEVVLAHELAHHVHGDIWKGIALESVLILAGFLLAARLLSALAGPAGLRGPGDLAGLPLLVLAAGGVSMAMIPLTHALSRAFERRADRFALALTKNPAAFVSAMRRLGAQNLAEDDPSRVVQWLFYSHPPLRERIAAAEAFRG